MAILCLLIKLDVGGFGSGVLAPVLKDVPVINKILPVDSTVTTDDGESYGGYTSLREAVDYIKENTRADGIISTRPGMVKRAMELGLIGGQRAFLIDSIALENTRKQLAAFQPDFMEIMPGMMPKILKRIRETTSVLLVAGGLLSDKQDIMAAFQAGVDAVSTTKEELWEV